MPYIFVYLSASLGYTSEMAYTETWRSASGVLLLSFKLVAKDFTASMGQAPCLLTRYRYLKRILKKMELGDDAIENINDDRRGFSATFRHWESLACSDVHTTTTGSHPIQPEHSAGRGYLLFIYLLGRAIS